MAALAASLAIRRSVEAALPSSVWSLDVTPGSYKSVVLREWSFKVSYAISTGMCPELIFPYIPYLLTYPSGSSPALSRRRKNTGVNLK